MSSLQDLGDSDPAYQDYVLRWGYFTPLGLGLASVQAGVEFGAMGGLARGVGDKPGCGNLKVVEPFKCLVSSFRQPKKCLDRIRHKTGGGKMRIRRIRRK